MAVQIGTQRWRPHLDHRVTLHNLYSPNFQGYWSSGNRSGHGVMFYSDNTNYMGRWVNDKRSGYGVLRNNLEGWRFLSLWKEDKKHGRGIFIRFVFKSCFLATTEDHTGRKDWY